MIPFLFIKSSKQILTGNLFFAYGKKTSTSHYIFIVTKILKLQYM